MLTQPLTTYQENPKRDGITGQMSIANTAKKPCRQGETAVGNSVQQPVSKLPTGSENNCCVTLATGRRNERPCNHCNKIYTFKRKTSKFCSGGCRVAAHYKRHPRTCNRCKRPATGRNGYLCGEHRAEYQAEKAAKLNA